MTNEWLVLDIGLRSNGHGFMDDVARYGCSFIAINDC
jgi:hypothetical protein